MFALFMKLATKRKINRTQLQVTLLSNQYEQMTQQISLFEQIKANAQDSVDNILNCINSTAQNIFNASTSTIYTKANALQKQMSEETDPTKKADLKAKYEAAAEEAKKEYMVAQGVYQTGLVGSAGAKQIINSVFSAADEAQLKMLKIKQTNIDLQKESQENMLVKLNADYESYSKLAETEAKEAAPKFA